MLNAKCLMKPSPLIIPQWQRGRRGLSGCSRTLEKISVNLRFPRCPRSNYYNKGCVTCH